VFHASRYQSGIDSAFKRALKHAVLTFGANLRRINLASMGATLWLVRCRWPQVERPLRDFWMLLEIAFAGVFIVELYQIATRMTVANGVSWLPILNSRHDQTRCLRERGKETGVTE
jgi:hypothetical protein